MSSLWVGGLIGHFLGRQRSFTPDRDSTGGGSRARLWLPVRARLRPDLP